MQDKRTICYSQIKSKIPRIHNHCLVFGDWNSSTSNSEDCQSIRFRSFTSRSIAKRFHPAESELNNRASNLDVTFPKETKTTYFAHKEIKPFTILAAVCSIFHAMQANATTVIIERYLDIMADPGLSMLAESFSRVGNVLFAGQGFVRSPMPVVRGKWNTRQWKTVGDGYSGYCNYRSIG